MKICDKDGDGKLSYKEYEKFIIRAMNPTHKKKWIKLIKFYKLKN